MKLVLALHFGLIQLADFETHGQQPIELALSRERGFTWSRPFRDTIFLPVGAAEQFDTARLWSIGTPIVVGDEMRFYYGGAENPWTFGKVPSVWRTTGRRPRTGIGLPAGDVMIRIHLENAEVFA